MWVMMGRSGPTDSFTVPLRPPSVKAASRYRGAPARLHAALCIALRMKPIALWWLYITSVDMPSGFMCVMSVCSEDVTTHENIPSTHFHMKYSHRINLLLPIKAIVFPQYMLSVVPRRTIFFWHYLTQYLSASTVMLYIKVLVQY